MAKRYARINFVNSPSTTTPLNATNLNKLDKGVDDCDNAIETINANFENYTKMQPTIRTGGNANSFVETFSMGYDIVNSPYYGQASNACVFINIPYESSTIVASNYAAQICIPVQNISLLPKYRQKSGGVWTAWKDF